MAYNTIPVDEETYRSVKLLCKVYDMGERAQGALVKKVVKAELKQAQAQGLISDKQMMEIKGDQEQG